MRTIWSIELLGGDEAADLVVERGQRNLVALADDRIAERGGHLGGVQQLLLRALRRSASRR